MAGRVLDPISFEVIRNALRLFEALVQEHEAGAEFSLKRANGETVAYKIFV